MSALFAPVPQHTAAAILLLILGLPAAPAAANPVPADELSLLNGADQFQQHCTRCHGWDPSQQYTALYGEDPVAGEDPLAELLRPPPEPTPEELTEEIDDYWPEYAERPIEPEVSEDEQLKSDILDDLTSAIDEVYSEETDPWGWEVEDYDEYQTYDEMVADDSLIATLEEDDISNRRLPGATDLTDPDNLIYGTREVDLFNNIAHGTGPTMPGFRYRLRSEEAIWDLVNYIRSLWGPEFVD